MPIKVSRPPATTGTKSTSEKARPQPTSTLFTSPIGPDSRRDKGKGRAETNNYPDEFLDDDSDDDFNPPKIAVPRRTRQPVDLGPPITTDDRMDEINEVHRDVVEEFVREAIRLDDKIRNNNGHKSRYFSDSVYREMAINWTLSIDDMNDIPGIDPDKVARYGKKFIPLIEKCYQGYNAMMDQSIHRDMDPNHQIIDLCDDDDEEEEEDEDYGDGSEDDDEDNHTSEQSRFFAASRAVERFNQEMSEAQKLPQTRHGKPEPAKKPGRGNIKARGRGRGGKRKSSGRSNGSSSGAARKSYGNSGVAKKAAPTRKTSYAKKTTGSFSKTTNVFDKYKNGGGGGGASGGSGLSMPL